MIVSRQRRPVHLQDYGWVNFVVGAVTSLIEADKSHYAPDRPPVPAKVSPMTWAALGVGGIVLIGGLAYAIRSR